jgi:hypothetical protein
VDAAVAVAISIVVVEIGSSSGVGIEEGTPFRVDGQLQQLAQKQQKPDAWTQMDEDFEMSSL